ncbi:MAG: hypothetical protein ABWY63_14255 [Hyphomicrobiaceae bacterium]
MIQVTDEVAKEYAWQARHALWNRDLDRLRDWLDTKTWGELDCFQLDLLTQMVAKRLKERNYK